MASSSSVLESSNKDQQLVQQQDKPERVPYVISGSTTKLQE